MRRMKKKNLIALFFAAITIFAVCMPANAAVERQSVHINTPGISIEIPGNAIYNVQENDTGELMSATDEDNTYKLTLVSEKSKEIFTYKDLSREEIDKTQNEIQSQENADKVTAYETSQAVFFDCINNSDKYLLTTTIVNGYTYTLKLAVEKRELTISDHGIFNTAARSIVFDNVEKKPVEVNVLGTIGTIVCIAVGVIVVIALVVVLVRAAGKKLPKKKKEDGREKLVQKREQPKHRKALDADAEQGVRKSTKHVEKPSDDTLKPIKREKPQPKKTQPIRIKKRDTRTDSAAESFYNEIESDGLFDEQAAEEIPTQVQLDFIDNQPGDENFENNPVRMRVDIIKPVTDREDAEASDLFELSRNNNEDYDEAVSDDEYPDDDGFGERVKGIFGKGQKDNINVGGDSKTERRKSRSSEPSKPRERAQRTEEERQRAAQRRSQRQASRPEHKSSYSDSEFVKNFDNDSYWDKYR